MKTDPRMEKDPELQGVLREWTVETSLPPGFRNQVWRKIEQSQRSSGDATNGLSWIGNWLGRRLSRPSLAVSYLAALILLGGTIGWAQSQHRTAEVSDELSHRYVQSLDPYQTPR